MLKYIFSLTYGLPFSVLKISIFSGGIPSSSDKASLQRLRLPPSIFCLIHRETYSLCVTFRRIQFFHIPNNPCLLKKRYRICISAFLLPRGTKNHARRCEKHYGNIVKARASGLRYRSFLRIFTYIHYILHILYT